MNGKPISRKFDRRRPNLIHLFKLGISGFLFLILSACTTEMAFAQTYRPASLDMSDAKNREAVRLALSEALGEAHFEFGAFDTPRTHVITILPPRPSPYETRAMAMPKRFGIFLSGSKCYAANGERPRQAYIFLRGVRCVPD